LGNQVIQIVIGLENNAATSAPVSAARSPLWDKGLAVKCDRPLAAMAGFGVNLDLVDKHRSAD